MLATLNFTMITCHSLTIVCLEFPLQVPYMILTLITSGCQIFRVRFVTLFLRTIPLSAAERDQRDEAHTIP